MSEFGDSDNIPFLRNFGKELSAAEKAIQLFREDMEIRGFNPNDQVDQDVYAEQLRQLAEDE